MAAPGIITNQVIRELLEAPLVIADLTEHNANVYYELAIRHAIRKPLVELIKTGEVVPFDVAATRVLHLDDPDLDNVGALRTRVDAAIKAAESKSTHADNPITMAIDILNLGKGDKPVDEHLAGIIEILAEIQARIIEIQENTKPSLLAALASNAGPRRGGMAVGLEDLFRSPSDREEHERQMAALQKLADGIRKELAGLGKSKDK
jgi:hypothetical protein